MRKIRHAWRKTNLLSDCVSPPFRLTIMKIPSHLPFASMFACARLAFGGFRCASLGDRRTNTHFDSIFIFSWLLSSRNVAIGIVSITNKLNENEEMPAGQNIN